MKFCYLVSKKEMTNLNCVGFVSDEMAYVQPSVVAVMRLEVDRAGRMDGKSPLSPSGTLVVSLRIS